MYGFLCQLIESNHAVALANINHIARALAAVVGTKMLTDTEGLNERVVAILKQLAAHHGEVLGQLDPALQHKVHQAIQA